MDRSGFFEDYLEILHLDPNFTKEELQAAMVIATKNASSKDIDRYLDMYLKLTGTKKDEYIKDCLAFRETARLFDKKVDTPNGQAPKLPYGIEIPKIIDERPCELFPYATSMGFIVGFSSITVDDNLEVILYHPGTRAMIYLEVEENGTISSRYNGTPIVHFPIKKELSSGSTVLDTIEIRHLPLTDDTMNIIKGHRLAEWPPLENDTLSFINSISDEKTTEQISQENGEDAAKKFAYIRTSQKIFSSDNKMKDMLGYYNVQLVSDTVQEYGKGVKEAIDGATGKKR